MFIFVKKNTVLLFFIFIMLHGIAYAQIAGMDEFMSKKIEFYSQASNEEAVKAVTKELELLEKNKAKYSEELFLTLENNLLLEKINFLESSAGKKKESYLMLNNQALKNNLFMEGKSQKRLSADYMTSAADIMSRMLPFLPPAQMYTKSMDAKNLYTAAIKKDKKSVPALLGLAMWLYFAPPVAGGGYTESYKKFLEAEKYADTNEKRYMVWVLKSQILFAMNKKAGAAEHLQKAHALFPQEQFTKTIGEDNEKGKPFFN